MNIKRLSNVVEYEYVFKTIYNEIEKKYPNSVKNISNLLYRIYEKKILDNYSKTYIPNASWIMYAVGTYDIFSLLKINGKPAFILSTFYVSAVDSYTSMKTLVSKNVIFDESVYDILRTHEDGKEWNRLYLDEDLNSIFFEIYEIINGLKK